jgi:hypothetical protein
MPVRYKGLGLIHKRALPYPRIAKETIPSSSRQTRQPTIWALPQGKRCTLSNSRTSSVQCRDSK